jgi:uncharacterized protein DUF6491
MLLARETSMKSLCFAAIATLSLLALGACATGPETKTGAAAVPSPPGKEDCLFVRTMDDWSPVDRERLMIYGMGRVPYLATLSFPSPDLGFNFAIGFQDADHDGRFCSGFDAILLRSGSIPDRITIASLQRLDKADAKAFMEAVHPKRVKAHKIDKAATQAAGDTAAPAASGR